MNDVLSEMLDRYPDLQECTQDIGAAFERIRDAYKQGGKLLTCGNGGSAADSEHIVGELMKGFMFKRPVADSVRERLIQDHPDIGAYVADHLQGALPAISLTSNGALMTAFGNDVAGDMVFAQQVFGYGTAGDVVLGISTSGNSKNVVYALRVAKSLGLTTIGLTGKNGGVMKGICDVCICAPYEETPKVQERHLPIYHTLCMMLEEAFFER